MGDQLLTLPGAARALGVSAMTIRRLESRGGLKAARCDGRWKLFRLDDVKAALNQAGRQPNARQFRLRTEGEVTARAFDLFRRGLSHEQVVIALEQPASRIRQLFDEWRAGYRPLPEPRARSVDAAADDEPTSTEKEIREWEHAMAGLMRLDAQDEARDDAEHARRRTRRRDRSAGALVRALSTSR